MGFLTRFLLAFISFWEFMLILRCLFSWVLNVHTSRAAQFVYMCTDPLVKPFQPVLRNISFLRTLPIDLSPLCAFIILQALQNLIY